MARHGMAGLIVAAELAAGAAKADTVKIAVAGPFTSPNASYGLQLKNGAQQAVEDINAKGGILGNKVELIVGDDQSDPKPGVSIANKFVAEGVTFVDGHMNSGVTIPASDVAGPIGKAFLEFGNLLVPIEADFGRSRWT